MSTIPKPVQTLIDRGVKVHAPLSVDIDDSIQPEKIASDVVIHAGCRVSGSRTSIGPSTVIGEEGPVTIDDCRLGADVVLKGGFFSGATLMNGVTFGPCAHVRPGTLLEEQASCAHCVGLKQTMLMPFVTLGSLINFCDCLMAGGTDRTNHSEVGSSFIHFNYTPYRDKATASLIGDVPRGVMLDQPPIFLGGQGGIVGPARIEYGTVTAAGTICRKDIVEPNTLVVEGIKSISRRRRCDPDARGNINSVITNNFVYLGNLHALFSWYRTVRSRFMNADQWDKACCEGGMNRIRAMITERVKRLAELAERIGNAPSQKAFAHAWPGLAERLNANADRASATEPPPAFMAGLEAVASSTSYLDAVKALPPEVKTAGTTWLQSIVNGFVSIWKDRQ